MSKPFPLGGRFLMLPNQQNQALPDIGRNIVSVYVEEAVIPKYSGLFYSDQSLGLSFKILANYMASSTAYGSVASTVNVTKTYTFDVTRDSGGNVSLPLNSLPVVDTCPLTTNSSSGQAYLSDLEMSLTFLSTEESSGFNDVLQQVFQLSSKLPIPNPYTPYVSLLGDGISSVVQAIQGQDTNPQPLSTAAFQFAGPAATLSGYWVLLMSTDQDAGPGVADFNNLDVTQLGYDPSAGLTYGGVACENAYVVFRVAYFTEPVPGSQTQQPAPQPQPAPKPALQVQRSPLLDASVGLTANLLSNQILKKARQ
jgi:hypothetical protein